MFDRFEDDAKRAMNEARKEAQRLGHDFLDAENVLLGLLLVPSCTAVRMLQTLGLDIEAIRARALSLLAPMKVEITETPFTKRSKPVLERAFEESGRLGDEYLGTEHLLLGYALCVEQDSEDRFTSVLGVDAQRLRSTLDKVTRGENAPPKPRAEGSIPERLAHLAQSFRGIKDDLVHERRFKQAARLHELIVEIMNLASEISKTSS